MRYMYTIRDIVDETCGPIHVNSSDARARRLFDKFASEQPDGSEFELLCIGEFDDETGEVQHLVPFVVPPLAAVEDDNEVIPV